MRRLEFLVTLAITLLSAGVTAAVWLYYRN